MQRMIHFREQAFAFGISLGRSIVANPRHRADDLVGDVLTGCAATPALFRSGRQPPL